MPPSGPEVPRPTGVIDSNVDFVVAAYLNGDPPVVETQSNMKRHTKGDMGNGNASGGSQRDRRLHDSGAYPVSGRVCSDCRR